MAPLVFQLYNTEHRFQTGVLEAEVKRATKMFYVHKSIRLYTSHLARIMINNLWWIGRNMVKDLDTVISLVPLSPNKKHRLMHELDNKVLEIYENLMKEQKWGSLRKSDFYDTYVYGTREMD